MQERQADWGIQRDSVRAEAMRLSGAWHGKVLTDFFDPHAAASPERKAIVASRGDVGEVTRISYAQLAGAADKIAFGLRGLGVRRGDIVSFQLPNWWEFLAIVIACIRIGAVTHPIMPVLRHRELAFMAKLTGTRVLIVPQQFRGFDFETMAREVAAEVPTLQHTFAVGTAESSFTKYFLNSEWDVGTLEGERPDPDELMQLIFTSGTTGEPKGVMHTANTMFANVVPFAARMNLTARDVGFSPTPLAHQLGYLFGVLTPLMLGGTIVLQDIWNPAMAARLIEAERVTYCMGATPFLNDLAHFEGITGHDVGSLRYFISGGAPIPPALVQTATLRLGCKVIAIWGMTEVSAVTTVLPDDPPERASESDGTAMPHSEVRVADEGGNELPRGQSGRLLTRGSTQFVGYFKRPQLYTVNEEGWLDTGDLARMDASGYIRITGRAKDIIIRGGENIPVVEIEAMLHGHPAVQMVAIVAMPDPRLGERACAFVLPRPGLSLAFEEMRRFLEAQRVAPAYLPERLVLLDAMPLTPAGKVQKFVLRERASVLAAE